LLLYVIFLVASALWALELAQLLGLNEVALLAPHGLSGDALFDRFYGLVASETKVTGVLFQCQVGADGRRVAGGPALTARTG
jgi:hypothetical protein